MSAAMKIEEQIEQAAGGKQEGYKPRLVSIEEETQQQKSFEQVCGEAAEPIAALLNHTDMPREIARGILERLTDLEGHHTPTVSEGEQVRRILTRISVGLD